MLQKSDLIVGLDMGTTKICCIIGERTATGEMNIVGFGSHPSRGLRRGVVVDIETTVAAIRGAIAEAEQMAGCEVTHVYAGIAGGHIRGFNSHGVVAVKDAEVAAGDVARVLEAARSVAIPADREVLHILAQEYIIDAQAGIRAPLGMSGVRLEAKVHIVTGAASSAQNIVRCAQRCGVRVADIVLEQLASSEAVLSQDEKELGVVLVDMGGGTTDVAIWRDGSVAHTAVVPLGGDHLTHDLAVGLRTPVEAAERIKQTYGRASMKGIDADATLEVPGVGGRVPRQLSQRRVVDILAARLEEIFLLVRQEVERTGHLELVASGAVLTGGTTLLAGIAELAEDSLGLPVRCAAPVGVGGLVDVVGSPKHATGVGLVLYGRAKEEGQTAVPLHDTLYVRVRSRIRTWLGDFF